MIIKNNFLDLFSKESLLKRVVFIITTVDYPFVRLFKRNNIGKDRDTWMFILLIDLLVTAFMMPLRLS